MQKIYFKIFQKTNFFLKILLLPKIQNSFIHQRKFVKYLQIFHKILPKKSCLLKFLLN